MAYIHRNVYKIFYISTSVLFIFLQAQCLCIETNLNQKSHTRLIFYSIDTHHNLTLSSELDNSTKPKYDSLNGSVEFKPWKIKGFQIVNISEVLSKHVAVSFPAANTSKLLLSKGIASLNLVIKNFNHSMMYLNFSYFVGTTAKNITSLPTPTPTPTSVSSTPITIRPLEESSKPNKSNVVDTDMLARAIASESVTKFLPATTQNILKITSEVNDQVSDATNAKSTEISGGTQKIDSAVVISPLKIQSSSDSKTDSVIDSAATTFLNATSQLNSRQTDRQLSLLKRTGNDTVIAVSNSSTRQGTGSTIKSQNISGGSIVSYKVNSSSISIVTKLESDSNLELVPIINDMARKKRSVNDPISVNHSDAKSNAVDHILTAESKTSNDSPFSLPLTTSQVVEVTKNEAVVAAAAASKVGPSSGIITGHTASSSNLGLSTNTSNDDFGRGTPIKETDPSSSLSKMINLKGGNDVDEGRIARSHHDHEHHHKSKISPSAESSSTSSNNRKRKREKKVKTVERSGKTDSDTDDEVVGENSSSSSSRSEEEGMESVGGGAGKQKISYETWRASLEKRNRPPGLYVTANDDIIFDNRDGIWDKAHIMGKWTGAKTSQKHSNWNHTHIFLSWEGVSHSHDVKINFEWEPTDEGEFVILSDVVVSTIFVPTPCNPADPFPTLSSESASHNSTNTNSSQTEQINKAQETESKSSMNVTMPELAFDDDTLKIILLRQLSKRGEGIKWEVIKLEHSGSTSEKLFQRLPLSLNDKIILSSQKSKNITPTLNNSNESLSAAIEEVLSRLMFSANTSTLVAISNNTSTTTTVSPTATSSQTNTIPKSKDPPKVEAINPKVNASSPEGVNSTQKSKSVIKTDGKTALFVCIGTGVLSVCTLIFLVGKKLEISRKVNNAIF